MKRDARGALWIVLWSRAFTTFSGAVCALAYSFIAIHQMGGASAGVAVATCSAGGVLAGNLVGGLADFVRPPLVLAVAGLLGAVSAGGAYVIAVTEHLDLLLWCFLALLSALSTAAAARAENTAIVHIAPREQLPRLFGAISMRGQAAAAAAGTVSGLIIAADRSVPFLLDCSVSVLSLLLLIPLMKRYPNGSADASTFAPSELLRGFSFIMRSRPLLSVVLISAFANMFLAGAGAVITIDLISRGVDVRLVGLLETVVNVAALLGSVGSGILSRRLATGRLFVFVLAVLTLSMSVMAVWGNVAVVMAALACGVFLIPALGVSAAVSVATHTPSGLQARTSGANSVISLLLASVSPAALGSVYVHTSRFVVLTIVAAGTLVSAVISQRFVPDGASSVAR